MTDVLVGLARAVPASVLVPVPIVVPLLAAALALLARRPVAQRVVAFTALGLVTVAAGLLVVRADADGPLAVQAGGWPAPLGITLVADRLSALLTLTSAVVLVIVLVYAVGQGVADQMHAAGEPSARRLFVFHPVYLVLAAGVSFAFLTGDLFNLFVALEVMLTASYVLITLQAQAEGIRSAMTYVVTNLLASTLLVMTIGLIYAATGTVNMAQLSERVQTLPGGVRLALGLALLVVFGIKAALFPLFFWLPDSYPVAPAPVTAVFAGLLTKVGAYAIIRTQTLDFQADRHVIGPVILVIAGATLVVGILGAIAQTELKRLLSFTIVSHIGYIMMGLGLWTVAGLTGAILYVVHHIVVQATLFCVEGLVERRTGTSELDQISGLMHTSPVIAGLFALPALSLAGIPPLSGFVAKLALIEAGTAVDQWAIVGGAVLVSLLTLYVMGMVWSGGFWGRPGRLVPDVDPSDDLVVGTRVVPRLMTGATTALVVMGLVIPLVAGPLVGYSERAAHDLVHPGSYVGAVLGEGAR